MKTARFAKISWVVMSFVGLASCDSDKDQEEYEADGGEEIGLNPNNTASGSTHGTATYTSGPGTMSGPMTIGPGSGPHATMGRESATSDTGNPSQGDSSSDAADGTAGGGETEGGEELWALKVGPQQKLMTTDLNDPTEVVYTATGYFGSESLDITQSTLWSIDNPDLGHFEDNVLKISGSDQLGVRYASITASQAGVSSTTRITVAAYKSTGENADFFFVLPYQDSTGEMSQELEFETSVRQLDVFFAMDTTKSMEEEISNLRESLQSTVIPELTTSIPDTAFGVGSIEDFPFDTYGGDGTDPDGGRIVQPFTLHQAITTDSSLVQSAVDSLDTASGKDYPESVIEALYQIATGEGLDGPGGTYVAPHLDGIGGVGFREGSLPVIVPITDEISHATTEYHCSDPERPIAYVGPVAQVAHSRADTQDAINSICGRVISITTSFATRSYECSPRYDGDLFANATNTRVMPAIWGEISARPEGCDESQCCTGLNGRGQSVDGDGLCPLVFEVSSSGRGLGDTLVTAIESLAFYVPIDVRGEKSGETQSEDGELLPEGVSTSDFIKEIRPFSYDQSDLAGLPDPTLTNDRFENVIPGTRLTFNVEAFNDVVEPKNYPQFFRASVSVHADDECNGTAFDNRNVLILVPAVED